MVGDRWFGQYILVLWWPLLLLLLPLRSVFDSLSPCVRDHDELLYLPFLFGYYYLWLHPLSEADPRKRMIKIVVFSLAFGIVVAGYWLVFRRIDFD